MEHQMKLTESAFEAIKQGTKKLEIRLNDEKRQRVQIGDTIRFQKLPDLKDSVRATITGKPIFKDFKHMLISSELSDFGTRYNSKKEILTGLRKFYSSREEKKYGVVVFQIKPF